MLAHHWYATCDVALACQSANLAAFQGTVSHRVRNGALTGPKEFAAKIHQFAACPANCTSLGFHPVQQQHFLAARVGGGVSMLVLY